jgi:hypothetical protein
VFQLENVIGMVEGLAYQTEAHGVNAWQHNSSLHLERASDVTACPSPNIASPGISNTENNSPACPPAVPQDSCERHAKS